MAGRKGTGPQGPVYDAVEDDGALSVRLRYPFAVAGGRVEAVTLVPPTLGDLLLLRAMEARGAAEILAPMTGLGEEVILAMRWPDVEAVLEAAMGLLPPDLFPFAADAPQPEMPVREAPGAPPQASPDGVVPWTDPDDPDLPKATAADMPDFLTSI